MAWWSKKEAPTRESEPEPETEPDEGEEGASGWDGWEEEPTETEQETDAEQNVEALLQERVQPLREKLAAYGLDLSDEGEPLIRDPKRFRDWARPAVGEAPRAPTPATAPEPKEPAPAPTTAPPQVDLWEMTPEQFRAAVREEAERITQPVLEELRATKGLVGKKYVDEATRAAAEALQTVAPDYLHILDHPEFEDLYRKHLANLPPEYLDNPQVLASTALGLVAWLDPEQMPERKKDLTAGMAQAVVNRAGIPQSRPVLDQSAAAIARGIDPATRAARWLRDNEVARIAPEEWDALDAKDVLGVHTLNEYVKAKRRLVKSKAR